MAWKEQLLAVGDRVWFLAEPCLIHPTHCHLLRCVGLNKDIHSLPRSIFWRLSERSHSDTAGQLDEACEQATNRSTVYTHFALLARFSRYFRGSLAMNSLHRVDDDAARLTDIWYDHPELQVQRVVGPSSHPAVASNRGTHVISASSSFVREHARGAEPLQPHRLH
ncbi:hypothetical protein BDW02DRAFT_367748 [Decorospora gaudefroyi]|uniref:Uncharacterized protein n=1 Tax=Decorospora gaudefroyi TaxID=184978 RepID=A0A6A5KTU9_9PLEO|nr:hypothetical protein BDW02DRAFT_367748 [Decorospora gaudefroyi]